MMIDDVNDDHDVTDVDDDCYDSNDVDNIDSVCLKMMLKLYIDEYDDR